MPWGTDSYIRTRHYGKTIDIDVLQLDRISKHTVNFEELLDVVMLCVVNLIPSRRSDKLLNCTCTFERSIKKLIHGWINE